MQQPLPHDRRSWGNNPPEDIKTYDGPDDPLKTHAFNEKSSNSLDSDRAVPDTRVGDVLANNLPYNLPNNLPMFLRVIGNVVGVALGLMADPPNHVRF
jgi:hypothetical protein